MTVNTYRNFQYLTTHTVKQSLAITPYESGTKDYWFEAVKLLDGKAKSLAWEMVVNTLGQCPVLKGVEVYVAPFSKPRVAD